MESDKLFSYRCYRVVVLVRPVAKRLRRRPLYVINTAHRSTHGNNNNNNYYRYQSSRHIVVGSLQWCRARPTPSELCEFHWYTVLRTCRLYTWTADNIDFRKSKKTPFTLFVIWLHWNFAPFWSCKRKNHITDTSYYNATIITIMRQLLTLNTFYSIVSAKVGSIQGRS